MPWVFPEQKRAAFFPFGQLADALAAKEPTTWILDDLGWIQSLGDQNAWCHLIYERTTPNGDRLPDGVSIVATTNERQHKASGVGAFSDPFKTRFDAIYELRPDLDDSCKWFFKHYPEIWEVPAFLRESPEDLNDIKTVTTDLTNRANPRTWASAARKLRLKLPEHLELAALVGAIGKGMAVKFHGVVKMLRSMPSIDAILANPDHVAMPTTISGLWGSAQGLAARANVKNFSRVARFGERLEENGNGEFAVFMIRLATEKTPAIINTQPYIQLMSGSLGKLVTGEGE